MKILLISNIMGTQRRQSYLDIVKIKELAKISSKIEMKRNELGMNQKEFARMMNVSQGMVSKWESGEYNFTITTLKEICDKLGLGFEAYIYDLYEEKRKEG